VAREFTPRRVINQVALQGKAKGSRLDGGVRYTLLLEHLMNSTHGGKPRLVIVRPQADTLGLQFSQACRNLDA